MRLISLLITVFLCGSVGAAQNDRFAKVEVKTTKVSANVYRLEGAGGNIGALIGEDGILLVDNQFRPLAEKITAALNDISEQPVKYIVNTHYHGDHTGGNAWFREMKDSTLLAHENVRVRLAEKEDSDPNALPFLTFEDGVKFHINGETVHVIHRASSHTDGDSIVYFENANVIHAGDILFNQRFPYIDKDAGGTVEGAIGSLEYMIGMSDTDTRIIAGHGEIADRAQLQQNVDMIRATSSYVAKQKAAGKSEAEIIEMGLGEKWTSWGQHWITEERWIKTLY